MSFRYLCSTAPLADRRYAKRARTPIVTEAKLGLRPRRTSQRWMMVPQRAPANSMALMGLVECRGSLRTIWWFFLKVTALA
jgi:hypothetical protein